MSTIIYIAGMTVLVFMLSLFVLAQIKKDNSIVDIGWGLGFIALTAALVNFVAFIDIKDVVLTIMVILWGGRLALHIYLRARLKGEDFRYAQWRKDWGRHAVIHALVKVFLFQGLLMLVIASPVIVIFSSTNDYLTWYSIAGIVVFLFGFIFEGIGDYQLKNFKKNPYNKGKIITTGLWKYSRHPNYFGESVVWWGIGIFTLGSEMSYLAFLGPLTLNLLLIHVSGIPLLEKKYENNAEWQVYKMKTPAFLPLFGKKG